LSLKNAAKSALEHPHWRNVESAFAATKMIVELARQTNRRIHILHVSTREEMEYLALHKDLVSVEVTPQHLTLHSPDCYERLGTYAQMNPPIREKVHQDGLWWGIRQGIADVIGSDHAPHTKEEKEKGYPNTPSGMPGVQTLVPIMLNHVHEGALSLERFVDMASTRPAQIYRQNKGRIGVGADGDVTIVDLGKRQKISHVDQASRCGWTPYNDMEVYGWPLYTVVAGEIVMAHGELVKTAPV
jgi:dihydroorotase